MEENKFYSAKFDRAFKETFLKEKNHDLLKGILEDALEVKISKLELKPTVKLSSNVHIREKTLDALLDTNIGKIDVEVNSKVENYVRPRNMSYLCNEYASHTLVGKEYTEDTMIMQVNFTYEMSRKAPPKRIYYIQDEEGDKFVKNFKIIEINMEYYLNLWYDFKKGKGNDALIEKHQLLVMLGLELDDLEKLSKKYKKVGRYLMEIKIVNEDPEFRSYMTEEEDREIIQNTLVNEAKEEGIKQGLEQGLEQGIEQGSKNKEIEIAKNLMAKGVSKEIIIDSTGLSKKEIEELN